MESSKKIAITFFLPTLEGGGAERNVINFIKNLPSSRYDIALMLAKKTGAFLEDVPSHVKIINLNTASLFVIFIKLFWYFRRNSTQIFISSFPRFNAVSLLAKIISLAKLKIIIIEHKAFSLFATTSKLPSHRFIAKFIFPYFIQFFYPIADIIICVSRGVQEDLLAFLPSSKKITVIYNPVAEAYINQLSLQKVSHPWFANEEIPVIITAGRLIKAKDHQTLLKAFALVIEKIPAHLVILGEGDRRQSLELTAKNMGIADSVAFLGFQKNPYSYIASAKVFVLSSLHEGFGNVIVEAMQCGLPVVSTNCKSGPDEIIQQGENGLLVPVGDYNALSQALLDVLTNTGLAKKLSEAGRERAQYFSVEKSVQAYEKIFEVLIKKNN